MMKKLLASVLALALATFPAAAQTTNPVTNFQSFLNQKIVPNGRGLITGTDLNNVLNRLLPIFNSACPSFDVNGNCVVNPANLSSALLPHVANTAAFAALFPGVTTAVRDGATTAGDGGAATYTNSSLPCSLNNGAGDQGAQIPDGRGGCWNADLTKPISAAVWGVKSDCVTDDQPAWKAAVFALGALNGGGTLIMPATGKCSLLARTLSIQTSNIKIVGNGGPAYSGPQPSSFGLNFPTGNGIEIGGNIYSSTFTANVTLDRIGVNPLVTRTSGANVEVYRAANTHLHGVRCRGDNGKYRICIGIDGALYTQENTLDTELSFVTAAFGQTGICEGCQYNFYTATAAAVSSGQTSIPLASTAGMVVGLGLSTALGANGAIGAINGCPITAIIGNTVTIQSNCAPTISIPSGTAASAVPTLATSTVLHHLELTNHDGAAEELQNIGGLSQDDINTDFNGIGLWAHPQTGQLVSGLIGDKTAFDASGTNGVLFDTSGGGLVFLNELSSLWISSCGSPISQGVVTTVNPSSCMKETGPVGTIYANKLHFYNISAATGHCLEFDSSVRDQQMDGQIGNCAFFNAAGSFNAINATNASHWSFTGTIGYTSNAPNIYPNNQGYSVAIIASGGTNPDFIRIIGDIGRSATGAIYNNSNGTHINTSQTY